MESDSMDYCQTQHQLSETILEGSMSATNHYRQLQRQWNETILGGVRNATNHYRGLIFCFANSNESLIYDYDTLPDIEPLQNMVKNFKMDGVINCDSFKFIKYIITMGNKNIIKTLTEIMYNKYKNVTLDNIRDIIVCADYYLIDLKYNRIRKSIIIPFLNSLTKEDSLIINKLFTDEDFMDKYVTIKRLHKVCKIVNDLQMLCNVCPVLCYDSEYKTYITTNKRSTHTDDNGLIYTTLGLNFINNKKYRLEYYDVGFENYCYSLQLDDTYQFVKFIIFNKNKEVITVDLTQPTIPFGISFRYNTLSFTAYSEDCDYIYFVYKKIVTE